MSEIDYVKKGYQYKHMVVLDTQILVEIDPEERITKSGIIIAGDDVNRRETAKETGIVRAKGPNAFCDLGEVVPEIGDRVLFGKYAGKEVNKRTDGQPWYKTMEDTNIALILKDIEEEREED
jgi:co-chaperonin GroES (HSP10)